ncbi:MAG: membrane protein insertion efficiency factor YidD [Methylophilaceae bacterium]|nr:membrane protein insertion efficiency factor YidD [Methylophilaceae bacterium]
MARLFIGLIRLYQYILSPYLGQQCRFNPTCSQYAIDAIDKHGAINGVIYAVRRLLRCHPWHAGGHDPVP